MENFAGKLRAILKEKKITQLALSKEIGMTDSGFIRMIESNKIKVKTLIKICDFLEVPLTKFLDINEQYQTDEYWFNKLKTINDEVLFWKIESAKLQEEINNLNNIK